MKKLVTTISIIFLLQPLLASAGLFFKEEWEKEDCPKKHSLAWCLADYQNRSKGIFDDTKERFSAKLKKAGVTDEGRIADLVMHTGLGTGVAINEFVFGNLFGGSVFLLNALMPDQVDQNRRDTYMVFFDEGDPNRTVKQVLEEFSAILEKALKAALPVLPKEAIVTELKNGYRIEMPGSACTEKFDCSVGYYKVNPEQTRWFKAEKKENIPAYLGGSTVFSPLTGATIGIGFYKLPKGINSATLAKAISEKLPPWVYWYIPTGYFGGNPFPIFLNQGNAMFFLKPEADCPVPDMPHVASRATHIEHHIEQAVSSKKDDAQLAGKDEEIFAQPERVQNINSEVPESGEKQDVKTAKPQESSPAQTKISEDL